MEYEWAFRLMGEMTGLAAVGLNLVALTAVLSRDIKQYDTGSEIEGSYRPRCGDSLLDKAAYYSSMPGRYLGYSVSRR